MVNRYIKVTIFIVAAGAILLLYFFVEPRNGNLPKCLFHELTNLYCPGCGVQRSFHALLNGHILRAIDHNLMFILFLPMIIYFLIAFVLDKKYPPSSFIYSKKFSLSILIFVMSFWVLRNIPVVPFAWLAP
jgi:hypothetical protein